MSRSGYCEYGEYEFMDLWDATVQRTLNGKRGQKFLVELAKAMDEMPHKILIADELVAEGGACCAIGVVCKSRGLNTKDIDYYDINEVGDLVDISGAMAAEIEYHNDQAGSFNETPHERWARMREWVDKQIKKDTP